MMITIQSILNVADNSGAFKVICIKILGKKKPFASIGDLLVVTVKLVLPFRKIKKGDVRLALLIRQRKPILRYNGLVLFMKKEAVLLLQKNKNLYGNRIKGPIPLELRHKKYMKIISIAPSVV